MDDKKITNLKSHVEHIAKLTGALSVAKANDFISPQEAKGIFNDFLKATGFKAVQKPVPAAPKAEEVK